MNLLKRLKNLWELSEIDIKTLSYSEINLDYNEQKGYVVKLEDDLSKLIEN